MYISTMYISTLKIFIVQTPLISDCKNEIQIWEDFVSFLIEYSVVIFNPKINMKLLIL